MNISRRGFFRSIGLGAAAVVAAPLLPAAAKPLVVTGMGQCWGKSMVNQYLTSRLIKSKAWGGVFVTGKDGIVSFTRGNRRKQI
jgi:hypothetical protein